MGQKNTQTNTAALIRVGAEFVFSEGATTKAEAQANGFTPFGNISEVTPQVDTQKVAHVSSNYGAPRKDREDVTQSQVAFKIKFTEFAMLVQKVMLGGIDGTDFTQLVQSAVNADALAFSTKAAVIGNWYDVLVSGARIRSATAITIATKTDGTDFVTDLRNGRIMFLTAQAADLTPVITAPAITAGSDLSFKGIKPGQSVKRSGIGRLYYYDQNSANRVFAAYEDFSCDVTLDTASAVNVTSFADLTASVLITDLVGNWLTRNASSKITVG